MFIMTTQVLFVTYSHSDHWKKENMNVTPGEFVMVGFGLAFVCLGYLYSLTDRAYLVGALAEQGERA